MRRLRHNPGAVRAGETLLETLKIVATIAVAAAIGVGAGKAISRITEDPAPPAAAPVVAAQPAPIRVKVTFAGLRPDGAGGDGARLRVGVRLRNRSAKRVSFDTPRIQVGQTFVLAAAPTDSLVSRTRSGLAAGASATGELRFQTGAATTRRLLRLRHTTLLIGGRKIAVRFDVAAAQPSTVANGTPGSATATTPAVP
ncbi:MAG: hypothetical protein QOI73_3259 [Solirubrobacteraceae bacterium]|nr:hypothetical protein [Solirubrobacteraceae bacterium]